MTARRSSLRRIPAALVLLAVSLRSAPAPGSEPADRLLDRVPPDASLVLVVEDLRTHLKAFIDSPLGAGLADSRLVREWLASDEGEALRRSRRDFEASLAAPMVEIVDGLVGRAVLLSLHLPEGAPPEAARGLLQTAVSDRDLLLRFIGAANAAERGSGVLLGVEARDRRGVSYSIRDFGDGRPDEAYALLDDGTFVWTNDERLVLEVIDRSVEDAERPKLTDRPALQRVRRALPDRAIARLFVDPRFIGRLAEADPDGPDFDTLPAPIAGYLEAIDALGAALEWREGPVLHVVEALDPDRLPGPIRSWASLSGDGETLLPLIPPSALLAAAGQMDFPALHDLVVASVPEGERGQVELIEEVVRGVLLGRDPRSEVLPAIGPGLVGWIDSPAASRPLREAPAVLVASVGDPKAAEALDNALRTILAFVALDDQEGEGRPFRLRVEEGEGARVTALVSGDGAGTTRFAYAIARGMIVIGTDAEAVASVLADRGAGEPEERSPALVARDRLFPDASTFAFLDLDAVGRLAAGRREALAELLEADAEDAEDLDRLLDLVSLFRGAYGTSALAEDGSLAHRRFGLIVADPEGR